MSSASSIIEKFGGILKAARALEIPASTIQGWKDGGFIPARRQHHVLTTAMRLGIPLTAEDFICPDPAPTEAAEA